jgi:Uma2 family endonuclease
LNPDPDDGIVVGMDTWEYLRGPEDLRRRELVFGVVREPPSPWSDHQRIVTHLTWAFEAHVRERALGVVIVSPIDVVLDPDNALILQPDVLFISNERSHIVKAQIWGPPDLVVEVGSRGTSRYDSTTKLEWYEKYGCREYWVIKPVLREVTVYNFGDTRVERTFAGDDLINSMVLPDLRLSAKQVLEA